jgi:hypothetical protein
VVQVDAFAFKQGAHFFEGGGLIIDEVFRDTLLIYCARDCELSALDD